MEIYQEVTEEDVLESQINSAWESLKKHRVSSERSNNLNADLLRLSVTAEKTLNSYLDKYCVLVKVAN